MHVLNDWLNSLHVDVREELIPDICAKIVQMGNKEPQFTANEIRIFLIATISLEKLKIFLTEMQRC